MQYIITIILMISLSIDSLAGMRFVPTQEGDHYVYFPKAKAKSVLVVAHGTIGKNEKASDVAYKFLKRWINHAEDNQVILVVPVFDTKRFGNLGGAYGGYRNLIGKYVQADVFVNSLVKQYSNQTKNRSSKFYLYGHSAGGQFVTRYAVTHPEKLIKGVISAAGRYSYPTKESKWPYGAGFLQKKVKWPDGSSSVKTFNPDLKSYAEAAEVLDVVVGDKDIKRQPVRPSHIGTNRVQFAYSWALAMNSHAANYGYRGNVEVHIVPNVGHNSSKLTPKAVSVLFGKQ